MNKGTVALVFSLLASSPVFAEDRAVLFADGAEHGGFGGPMMGVTNINGNNELVTGGGGAWLIDHRFFLGGRGTGITSGLENTNVDFGYGGLWTGYIFNPTNLVNFSIDVLIGAGGLSERDTSQHVHGNDDAVGVIEPGINMRLNLSRFAAFSLGANYRWVNGSSHTVLTDEELSGIGIYANVMFGKF